MYPLQCHAGFNVPARAGKFEIVAVAVTVQDPTLDSYFAIIDDPNIDPTGKAGLLIDSVEPPNENKFMLVNIKGDGSAYDTMLEWHPPEGIKTRYGTSLCFTNVKQGSVCVYVR